MAKLKIVGRQNLVYVSQKIANKIAEMKVGNMFDPNHLIDLGGEGFIELGQIKQIVPDDPLALAEQEKNDQLREKRIKQEREWGEYVDRCKQESADQKADRMARSWCLIAYSSLGNKTERDIENRPVIPAILRKSIVERLKSYFKNNPEKWDCPQEEYIDLIPQNGKSIFKAVREVLYKK